MKVTAGHHFRTDISVQKSERVNIDVVFGCVTKVGAD